MNSSRALHIEGSNSSSAPQSYKPSQSKLRKTTTFRIRHVDVTFPFEPYQPQRVFIERLLEALQRGENALLESPTGTGKTLCLLTAALSWQSAYTRALQYQASRGGAALTLPPPEAGSPEAEILAAAGVITAPSRPTAAPATVDLGAILGRGGGGYTYADGAGAAGGRGASGNAGAVTLGGGGPPPPKIIYASRTHSQLSQVARELKNSGYAPRLAVLGSREQLCVNSTVTKLPPAAQSHACRQLTRARRCAYQRGLNEWLESSGSLATLRLSSARSSDQLAGEATREGAAGAVSGCGGGGGGGSILDIEEMAALGRERTLCPYYLPRDERIQREAELLLVPYNYLIDPAVRSQAFGAGFEWGNAVVILDEAHNIEDVASESASFDLSAGDLARAIDELGAALKPLLGSLGAAQLLAASSAAKRMTEAGEEAASGVDKATLGFDPEEAYVLHQTLRRLEEAIQAESDEAAPAGGGSGAGAPPPPSVSAASLGLPAGVVVRDGDFIYRLLHGLNIHFGTKRILCELMESIVNYMAGRDALGGGGHPSRAYGLDHLRSVIERIFRSEQRAAEMCKYYKVVLHTPAEGKGGGGGGGGGGAGTLLPATARGRTLSYWCFSPSVAMGELKAQGVRSIVLASGTLSPLESYAAELLLPFRVRLENPHVISPSQVLIGVVAKGVTGRPLNSSFNNRDTLEYKRELGATLVNCLRYIPDGVLVFFPSYVAMTSAVTFWQTDNSGDVWRRMNSAKGCVVVEDRSPSAFGQQILAFNDAVANKVGAVMLAVCRGKASEGIDFADAAARGVLVTGLPYPPAADMKVVLKRRYLDDVRSRLDAARKGGLKSDLPPGCEPISGGQWYTQSSLRAVNQAIGRCIRHKNDYGVILLLDERFSREKGCVSAWLRPALREFQNVGGAVPEVVRFFKENESNHAARETTLGEASKLAAISAALRRESAAPADLGAGSVRATLATSGLTRRPVVEAALFQRFAAGSTLDEPETSTLPSEKKSLFALLTQQSATTNSTDVTQAPNERIPSPAVNILPKEAAVRRPAALVSAPMFGLNAVSSGGVKAVAPIARKQPPADPKAFLAEVKEVLGEQYNSFRAALQDFKSEIASDGKNTDTPVRKLALSMGQIFNMKSPSADSDRRKRLLLGLVAFIPVGLHQTFKQQLEDSSSSSKPVSGAKRVRDL